MRAGLEISDLLVDVAPGTLERRPVPKSSVMAALSSQGDHRGARLVQQLPVADDGSLDPEYVDRLLVSVHCEIQRLSEEFRHGARMARLLAPVVNALRHSGVPAPYRVVDLGCGTGYVVRWLAANTAWSDVELIGVDLHEPLVVEARRLAALEGLDCSFDLADAFELGNPAHVLISTGVLHHFRGDDLGKFFASHERVGPNAFVHIDFQPSFIAPLGSWLFHRTRMRLAIARFDGVRSAVRAYPLPQIGTATATWAPSFSTWAYAPTVRWTPLPCVLSTIVGARKPIATAVLDELGARGRRLQPLS